MENWRRAWNKSWSMKEHDVFVEVEVISQDLSRSWWNANVTINHTVVQMIGIIDLWSPLLLYSQSWETLFSESLGFSLHPSRLFFQCVSVFFKNLFYHCQPFLYSMHRENISMIKTSLTTCILNPRLPGMLPLLVLLFLSISVEGLAFFLTESYVIIFVMDFISYYHSGLHKTTFSCSWSSDRLTLPKSCHHFKKYFYTFVQYFV